VRFFVLLCGIVGCLGCQPDSLELDDDGITAAIRAIEAAQAKEAEAILVEGETVRGTAPDNGDADHPPEGYVRMTATARSGPAFGDAILLMDDEGKTVVPIFVGGTEALSIRLRLMNKRYPRPLTHDLMDDTITKLNAKVIRAQVDALDSDVYIGTLVLKRGNEILRLDARPSDAMAMAIGNAVPIYVAADVLKQAGIAVDKLDNDKPSHVDPISL
jgi:hypothetical protein